MGIYVTRAVLPELDEYIDEIKDIWDTHILTNMGPKHEQLKRQIKEYLDADSLELLVNGHMALEMTLQAMNLKGEVITTPFTFASTTHAIVRNGLTPVFCDIDPTTFTIDTEKIERLITDKTCAIMPVHVYGNICNVEEIERIARKNGLKVIYDAAHSFGEKYKGASVAKWGDASCFSFHATKVFNTIEGGAVCYKEKYIGEKIYQLKNFGIKNEDVVNGIGANAKMNEFCAAMGICNLRHVNNNIAKRRLVFERYQERLESIPGIQLNTIQKDVESNYSYFPIVIHENEAGWTRNEIADVLASNGYYARKYFYPITNAFDSYHGEFNPMETPIALHISKRVLTLPLYPDLEMKNVDEICDIIITCVKGV